LWPGDSSAASRRQRQRSLAATHRATCAGARRRLRGGSPAHGRAPSNRPETAQPYGMAHGSRRDRDDSRGHRSGVNDDAKAFGSVCGDWATGLRRIGGQEATKQNRNVSGGRRAGDGSSAGIAAGSFARAGSSGAGGKFRSNFSSASERVSADQGAESALS